MKLLTEAELGYIAGFLDGEGCLSIAKSQQGYYRPTITFYNSHKETINWVADKLGAEIFKRAKDTRLNKNYTKIHYSITIRKYSDSLMFLQLIKPYLRIKQKQAKIIVNLLNYLSDRNSYKFTQKDKIFLEECYMEIKRLNRGD